MSCVMGKFQAISGDFMFDQNSKAICPDFFFFNFRYVGDVQIPLASSMLLDNHGDVILSKNLYRNFIVHMCSLFDYGLISPEVFYENVKKLQVN